MFLKMDRESTVAALKRVLTGFAMPAVHLLAEGPQRVADIKALGIFSQDIFIDDVLRPILETLGVNTREFRRPRKVIV
jgi:hypothetical protein